MLEEKIGRNGKDNYKTIPIPDALIASNLRYFSRYILPTTGI